MTVRTAGYIQIMPYARSFSQGGDMPVAKLSREFYDKLGDRVAAELWAA